MKTVIIISKGDLVGAYKALTHVCKAHKEFSYHYLKSKKFPFVYKGWNFIKEKVV